MEINFVDNFLNTAEHKMAYEYCVSATYRVGERDNQDTPPTGMVHELKSHEFLYKLLVRKSEMAFPKLKEQMLYRMYVNCFAPGENPYFHIDGDEGTTLLYYPNLEWSIHEGGETQFYLEDNIQAIIPRQNRMVIFDASILHRATSFRTKHRYTIAIKYQ